MYYGIYVSPRGAVGDYLQRSVDDIYLVYAAIRDRLEVYQYPARPSQPSLVLVLAYHLPELPLPTSEGTLLYD
jgi:hypothetical protein